MRRVAGVTVAAVVGAVVVGVVLAACTGSGPEPGPSPSGSASPTTTAGPPAGPSSSSGGTPAPAALTPEVPPAPRFAATTGPITPELAQRMAPSWRAGCPVPLDHLRYVTVAYHGFDGAVQTGELVVNADAVETITRVFRTLFDAGYPVRSMRLVDDFGADDDASMAADNTSGFNCRVVAGTRTWSEHAYGRAIDLNPVENPYVDGGRVVPSVGAGFAARPDLPGVVHAHDVVVRAFAREGWSWGGSWAGPRDYQHFSATGR